ncbi:hypothetical protein GCM10009834_37490 [Streptomonospora arabica]|uniref:Transposase n=1 Tax=Streptomonospora halophila TaxID=427369 RepID=A0ABP9G692_9ACTN
MPSATAAAEAEPMPRKRRRAMRDRAECDAEVAIRCLVVTDKADLQQGRAAVGRYVRR